MPSPAHFVLAFLVAGLAGLGLPSPAAAAKATGGRQGGGSSYTDPTHGFSLDLPKGFAVRPQDRSRLGPFTPVPLASIFFMNPTMAAGQLAGIEPPDLEVRVYDAGGAGSLRDWLAAARFAPPGSSRPFRSAHVRGLRVCRSTMLAPACSVYLFRGNRIYQLTAISREGEAMIETFALAPIGRSPS